MGEIRVALGYKDIANESLSDETFLEAAGKVFPGLPQLHAEWDAARAIGP